MYYLQNTLLSIRTSVNKGMLANTYAAGRASNVAISYTEYKM